MRKIEQQMIEAVKAGGGWKSGNTAVRFGARDCVEVVLHGSVIAQIDPSGGIPMRWTLAGWNTTTTRSRINALCRAFAHGKGVTVKRGQAYAVVGPNHLRAVGSDEWVRA